MRSGFNIRDDLEELWDRIKALMAPSSWKVLLIDVDEENNRVFAARETALFWYCQHDNTNPREPQRKMSRAPYFLTGQWEMMGGYNVPFIKICTSSLPWAFPSCSHNPLTAVCIALAWEPLEGSLNRAALHKLGCFILSPMSRASDQQPRESRREIIEVSSYDVGCWTVLIWTECDKSKLPPTKGTEASG